MVLQTIGEPPTYQTDYVKVRQGLLSVVAWSQQHIVAIQLNPHTLGYFPAC